MAEILLRSPQDDEDEFLQLGAAIVEEEPLLHHLVWAVRDHHSGYDQRAEAVPQQYRVQYILWPSFHKDHGLIRIESAFNSNVGVSLADGIDILSRYRRQEGTGPPILQPPGFNPLTFRKPRRAEHSALFFKDNSYNRGSPILVAPVYDFGEDGQKQVRGCSLFNTETGITVVLDAAIMGEQIFEMSPILLATTNTFIFWDVATLDEIRWKCAMKFPRVFALKDSLPSFPSNGTLEDLYIVLGNRRRMNNLMKWFQDDPERRRRTAAEVYSTVVIEMLSTCLITLVPHAPNFVKKGIADGNAINTRRLTIDGTRWTPPFDGKFRLTLENENTSHQEVLQRFNMSVAVLNPIVFTPTDELLVTTRQKEHLTGFWFRRMCTQTKLEGRPAQEGIVAVDINQDLIQVLGRQQMQHHTEIFVPKSVSEFQERVNIENLALSGPLQLTPIVASRDEDVPCRGMLVYSAAANVLYIIDFIRSKLDAIQMAAVLDNLPNTKLVWSEWDASKLRLKLGVDLRSTVVLRPGLGDFGEAQEPEVFVPGVLFLGRNALEEQYRDHLSTLRRNSDKDLSKAVLSMITLAKLIPFLALENQEVLRAATVASVRILSAAIPAYVFPTPAEALRATVDTAKAERWMYEFNSDGLAQFYRAFLARWFESNERGVPQEELISSRTLLRFGRIPILQNPRHLTNEEDSAWRDLMQSSEIVEWKISRKLLMRKRLSTRLNADTNRQCPLCRLPPDAHLMGCFCGSILKTLQRAVGDLPDMEIYYEARNAVTESDREKVRNEVNLFFRRGAKFEECLRRDQPGNIRLRFDFFRRIPTPPHAESFPHDRRSVVDVVTRFSQPLGQVFIRQDAVKLDENVVGDYKWELGGEFHANCLTHSDVRTMEVFSGILQFRSGVGIPEDMPLGPPADR